MNEPDTTSSAIDTTGGFDGTFDDHAGAGTFTFNQDGISQDTDKAVTVIGGARVTIPYAWELNPSGPFTAEAWVKPSTLSVDGNDYRSVFASMGNGAGKWYRIALTYDGAMFRMYADGALLASSDGPCHRQYPVTRCGSQSRAPSTSGCVRQVPPTQSTLAELAVIWYEVLMNFKSNQSTLRQFLRSVLAGGATLLVGGAVLAGPPPGVLDSTHANVRAVIAVQEEVTTDLMAVEGILGTAVGLDDAEQPALIVYVDQDASTKADVIRALPPKLRGVGVKVELTEKFRALAGKPGGGGGAKVDHKAKQTAPIQLGTSGGWRNDLANGYCCGGTLGALVTAGGVQFILSNYHVFEADFVSGGNGIVANTGDFVIQPGLIDVGCNANSALNVATLVQVGSLPNNNVDCSVAQVVPGMVNADGAILEIGKVSTATVAASLSQAVKKSGRTTGLTRSKIGGLNATISVTYENECAGGTAFAKTFTGQIVIANRRSGFLAGGDSGSLMVEDVATNPRAIGLLYAGSNTSAIANPIGQVLNFLTGALGSPTTMVGN